MLHNNYSWVFTIQHNVPIETALGRLQGRDCIFLDHFAFEDGVGTLVLNGSINGDHCTPRQPDCFVPYTLRFLGILAIKIMALDLSDWKWSSCFDEIHDSEWIQSMEGKIPVEQRHFFVQTYDYVFDVVCCRGYELKVHHSEPRT